MSRLPAKPLSVAFLFTTFPKTSETFLQRDVAALIAQGLDVRLYSLWGGGGEFQGRPVRRFNLWKLVPLFLFTIPWNCVRRPRIVRDLFEGVIMRAPPSWLNCWENLLGAGFAGCFYREFRRDPPDLVHGAWSGAPATAGWLLWRILGVPFSCGAHAYDLYEHGGDWWLLEKLRLARFVQTSTETGRQGLIARGIPAEKIVTIRRGLTEFPVCKPLRHPRRPLRLICIARLVEKKGLHHQMRIYAALRDAKVPFEARIVGEGPLRAELIAQAMELHLERSVQFLGAKPHAEVWDQLAWADVLLHTGVVAPSGDRDGLPNVIPEAMAAGVLVISSPVSATTEAVQDECTGLVADVTQPLAWHAALTRLAADDELAERLRVAARAWVEENYDARRNTARLAELFRSAANS
ncbi:MAG: colanic acid biosynthesis glycosyltransferase WcaL [Opitutus sp.]|nr:colanic acid biosynthesis glycosyltransferase WcaL [Opitutus sp.]